MSNFKIESGMGVVPDRAGSAFKGKGQWNRTDPDMRLFFVIDPAIARIPKRVESRFGSFMCVSSRLNPLVFSRPKSVSIFHRSK